MHYPPSKRRPGRDQSNPRQTDSNKLQQDLLNLITGKSSIKILYKPSLEPLRPVENSRTHDTSRTESTDDELDGLSPRKFNHEHLTEADRQFSEFHQNPTYSRRGRSPQRSSAKSAPLKSPHGADDLARQVEELRVRLDKVLNILSILFSIFFSSKSKKRCEYSFNHANQHLTDKKSSPLYNRLDLLNIEYIR